MGHSHPLFRLVAAAAIVTLVAAAQGQESSSEPTSRAELITQQREEKAATAKPAEPDKVEKKLLILKERNVLQNFGGGVEGFFPKIGGVATGQGFALGLQYNKKGLAGGQLDLSTSGSVTTARSQRYYLGLKAPRLAGDLLELGFAAEQRNLTQVDFYGLGPESDLEDRTSFRLEDTNIGGSVAFKPVGRFVRAGFQGGILNVNTGAGQRANTPSTEELFSPSVIPGLADQTNFLRGGPFVEFDFRDSPTGPRAGSYFSAAYNFFDDRDLGRHDFRELDMEAQQYIPFFAKKRVIVLRARSVFTYADGDQTVPFYLKPWIGGPRELRGFRNYRFYDDNILVLNAEYRWEAFSGLDMALFFDAGQVAAKRDRFQLKEMETAAGVGFRFNVRNATFIRLDVAFSHEATRLWIRFGSPF